MAPEDNKRLNAQRGILLFERQKDNNNLVNIEGGMYHSYASISHSYYENELDLHITCFIPDNEYAQVFARVTLNSRNEYEHPAVCIDVPGGEYKTYYNFTETKDIADLVQEMFTDYTIPTLVSTIFWNVETHQVLCELLPSEISELILSM